MVIGKNQTDGCKQNNPAADYRGNASAAGLANGYGVIITGVPMETASNNCSTWALCIRIQPRDTLPPMAAGLLVP